MTHRNWNLFKYSLQKIIARTTATTNNEALGFLFYYLPLTSPLQAVSFFIFPSSLLLVPIYPVITLLIACLAPWPFACKFDGACPVVQENIWAFLCSHVSQEFTNYFQQPSPPGMLLCCFSAWGCSHPSFLCWHYGNTCPEHHFHPSTQKASMI